MKSKGIYRKINSIWEKLQDEESKILMEARLNYSITRDRPQLYAAVDEVVHDWSCSIVENFLEKSSGKGLILWGCGFDGTEIKRVLDLCHYSLDFFCDSDKRKVGMKIDGVPVISVEELTEKYTDYSVIIGSRKYKEEMNEVLLAHHFPKDNIMYPGYGCLQAVSGKIQYFDIFEPDENEVFVDAGAYNGGTTLDFVKWTNGKYRKVFVLEPLKDMCGCIENLCKENGLQNVCIKEAAAWNKEEKLFFSEEYAGSKVDEEGEIAILGMDIDSIVKDEKVTFIKMDIEGSELKALEGAKNVIQRERPKLAISLYHKYEDIIELPAYILELVPEYRFYIRHYRSDVCETVLYAIV